MRSVGEGSLHKEQASANDFRRRHPLRHGARRLAIIDGALATGAAVASGFDAGDGADFVVALVVLTMPSSSNVKFRRSSALREAAKSERATRRCWTREIA